MEYTIERREGNRAVISLQGRLDANSVQPLKDALTTAIAGGSTQLVVDMSAVSFIDSSGLSAFVTAFRLLREKNGILVLCRVGPQVKVALTQTRLSQVFPVYDDVDSAIADLDKR